MCFAAPGPWSARIRTRNCVLHTLLGWLPRGFISYKAFTFFGQIFQLCSVNEKLVTLCKGRIPYRALPNPCAATFATWHRLRFGLFLSLTTGREGEIILRFLFLGVLRCFTSPGCRLVKKALGLPCFEVAPFKRSAGQWMLALSAAFPRNFFASFVSAFSAKAFPTRAMCTLASPSFMDFFHYKLSSNSGFLNCFALCKSFVMVLTTRE